MTRLFLVCLLIVGPSCLDSNRRAGIYCNATQDCADKSQICDEEFHTCYSPDMGAAIVPCTDKTQCPTRAPICIMGLCSACVSNDQCAPNVCQSNGSCAPLGNSVYVDNRNGSCTGVHAGTQEDPHCQLATAVGVALVAQKPIVRVAGSSVAYDAIEIKPNATFDLTIVGPDKPTEESKARLYRKGADGLSLVATTSGALTLQRLEIQGSDEAMIDGVRCKGAGPVTRLTVRDSVIYGAGLSGLAGTNCGFVIESSEIRNNKTNGVSMADGTVSATSSHIHHNTDNGFYFSATSSTFMNFQKVEVDNNGQGFYLVSDFLNVTIEQSNIHHNSSGLDMAGNATATVNITNSVIHTNSSFGVHLTTSKSSLQFSTVANNGGGTADATGRGVHCNEASSIFASILSGNLKSTKGSQATDKCSLSQTVTGTGDNLGIAKEVVFDTGTAPFKLKVGNTPNRDCCVNKVSTQSGLPGVDYEGTTRPKGSALDIGAYEIE